MGRLLTLLQPNMNPFRWVLSALLAQVLHEKPVNCKPKEFLTFDPPPGETCGSYMTEFFSNPMAMGYVENEQATTSCQYCQYASEFFLPTWCAILISTSWRRVPFYPGRHLGQEVAVRVLYFCLHPLQLGHGSEWNQ